MSSGSLTDRLGMMAARTRSGAGPSVESAPEQFRVIRWFNAICDDRNNKIQPAVDYYKSAIQDGARYMTAMGNLEYMLAETPGLQHYYRGILIDCSQIRKWLELLMETMSARKYKHYMYDPEVRRKYGEVKTTEASKLVKADDEIAELSFQIRVVANVEHHLENLIEGFTTRNINLSRIVEVRKANLQDIWIDPTKGTQNV